MLVAKIQVSGVSANVVCRKTIPSGIIGAQIEIDYAAGIWQGLRKTVVFRSAFTKDVITDDNVVTIPAEVVSKPNVVLYVGVYGVDSDGKLAIPTLWAKLGVIWDATDPSGDESTNPALPVWAEILDKANTAEHIAQSLRQDAEAGRFDGAPGADGHTPEKGVDYFTADEVAEIEAGAAEKLKPELSKVKDDIGYLQAGGIAPFMTDFFDLDYGVNRFNGSVTTGILKSDGTINPNNTNYCTTDYIYCSDMVGKYPIFSIYRTNLDIFFTYSYQVICFYDVKHKLLSKNGFYGGANVKPDSTVVPVGAVYLRFSTFALSTYPTDVFQLTFEETKTDPTVYTDYSEPKEIIKQKHIIDTNTDAFRDIAESYSVSTSKFLQSCAKTPMITWVDDDCNYNSIAEVKSLCDELEIKCTFGCITRDLSTAKILERLKEYQSNGFHIASHTHTHDRWYKDTTNGTMFTIDECEADLITSLCTLRENGFLDGDMMIFSGGSAQRDGVEEIVSKWCRCAVKTIGIVNHLYGDGRYFIRRVFINKSKGYDYYKGLIDEAISNGDWLVFGSHSYDTSETGFDFDLMRNILQYAKSQSVSIKTLNQAYKIRKSVYDFYELFN